MGGFPALPSGNNPSVSAASGYAGAAASVYNSLQSRLQQAAQQHATLLRQKQVDEQTANQRDFENQLQMQKAGAIPANLPPSGDRGTGHDGVTLQRPESNPAVPENGKGQTLTSPRGDKYYMPTEQEQGKSFIPVGGLAGALQGAGWDGKTPITPEHSHSIMQALNEAQPKDEPYDIDTSGKFVDAQGNPTPVAIGRKTGVVKILTMGGGAQTTAASPAQGGSPGGPFAGPAQAPAGPPSLDSYSNGPFTVGGGQAPATPQGAPAPVAPGPPAQPVAAPVAQPGAPAPTPGAVRFAMPEKNEPTDQQLIIPGKKGPNGGAVVWNKKTKAMEELPYPAGTSDELNAEQKERKQEFNVRQNEAGTRQAEVNEGRTARLTAAKQALENKAAQDHEKAGQKKEAMQAMAQGFYDAGGVQPGETYFPPRYQNGIVVPGQATIMPADKDQAAARAKELKKTAAGFEKTAKTHKGEQERIEKQHGWGKFAAPQSPAQGAQTPAAPARAQRPAPPPDVTKALAPGRHTFGNGQVWNKNADGSMVYVSGGQ